MGDFDTFPVVTSLITIVITVLLYKVFKAKQIHKDEEEEEEEENEETKEMSSGPLKALKDSNEKYLLPLIEKEEISHDTRRFRFGLESKDHILGLPVGQHIHLSATINGELVIRSYTPVTSDDDHGFVDLVIKVYRRNVHPKFPDGGKMTQYLDEMKIGDTIAFRGPSGKLQYLGNGKFSIKKLRKDPPQIVSVKKVNMIAGGSGITPMLQLVNEVLKRSGDDTQLAMLYANQSEQDILLRDDLDVLAAKHQEQFKVWYTVDRASSQWKFSVGFVNDEMIKGNLFPPSPDTITLMCGPPPMINFACLPSLEKLNYDKELNFAY
ncbi:CLUMA_CG007221, isoform A [Clunio marinus]|uniref:NADH-cytochrome b5 reductase n=1 Tax=Clunio marinus TaxID=568069 RepID=A0A1J1I099_9DIPT|nr:CLUMA_CG007221, isoform A [Clunio marinus]